MGGDKNNFCSVFGQKFSLEKLLSSNDNRRRLNLDEKWLDFCETEKKNGNASPCMNEYVRRLASLQLDLVHLNSFINEICGLDLIITEDIFSTFDWSNQNFYVGKILYFDEEQPIEQIWVKFSALNLNLPKFELAASSIGYIPWKLGSSYELRLLSFDNSVHTKF